MGIVESVTTISIFLFKRGEYAMAKITAIRLPNGKVKITNSDITSIIGEEFNSSDDFFNKYKTINESTGVENDCVLLESING